MTRSPDHPISRFAKLAAVLIVAIAAALPACGQGVLMQLPPIVNSQGQPLAGVTVSVFQASGTLPNLVCGSPVTVYKDSALSQAFTTLTTDGFGNFPFYIGPSSNAYGYTVSGTNINSSVCYGFTAMGGSGSFSAITASAGPNSLAGGTTMTGGATISGGATVTGNFSAATVTNVGNVVYCDGQTGADIGAKCNAAYTAGSCATQYCTIRISSPGPNTLSITLPAGATNIPVWTFTTTMNFATPVSLECDPGVWLNYTGSGHAVTFGPNGLTGSTYDPRPYKTSGCVWTGGGSETEGLYFNKFVVKSFVQDSWFINDGNTSAFNIFYQSQNWDARVINVYMWNAAAPCFNGINLNGVDSDNVTGDGGASFIFVSNIHMQPTFGSDSCNTTGILVNGPQSIISQGSISGFNPLIRFRGRYAGNVTVSGLTDMEVTSTTSGACAIQYGDLNSDPDEATTFYVSHMTIRDTSIDLHNLDSFGTTAHAICPAQGSTGLVNTDLEGVIVNNITSGQPVVVMNNNGSQTGNRSNNLGYNATTSNPAPSNVFNVATGANGDLHTTPCGGCVWDGTDGDVYTIAGNTTITSGFLTVHGGNFQLDNNKPIQVKDNGGNYQSILEVDGSNDTNIAVANNSAAIQFATNSFAGTWATITSAKFSFQVPLAFTNIFASAVAPTIAGGGCGGSAATIANNNGTVGFEINVGSTPGSACTVTMPTAAHGWACSAVDVTTNSTSVFVQKQSPAASQSATQIVITNFNDTAAATAFTGSDVVRVSCQGY